MPLPLLVILFAASAAIAVVVLVLLKWDDIVNWFQSRNELKEEDKANIAFSIKKKMANGNCNFVQGIFSKKSGEVIDGRRVEAKKLDAETLKNLGRKQLTIYN